MTELFVAIVALILVVGPLVGWAVREDRHRRRQPGLQSKEVV